MENVNLDEPVTSIDKVQTMLDMNDADFRKLVVHQFMIGSETMDELRKGLNENTELTKANIASTAELVEIFRSAKTGASAFIWCGRNLRRFVQFIYPFALLAGAIAAIWHGKWPKWGE